MMSAVVRMFSVALLLMLTSACAPWSAIDPDSRSITIKDDYTLEAPLGWVKRNYDI